MVSFKLLLALAFSVISVRAGEQTCTFYLQTENAVPADPATSIHNAIYNIISGGLRSTEVTVNSNVTGNDPYTAVADMIVDDVDTIYILGYCQALAGAGISDGTVTYFVEQTSC